MEMNKYQEAARSTAIYPNKGENLIYPVLGLCGESGEVSEKLKKIIRDDKGIVSSEKKQDLKKELGDVLWYIANICSELNLTMEEVAECNIEKLASRKARNKLKGSGDDR